MHENLLKWLVHACDQKNDFRFLYDLEMPLRKRIELIAKEVYGAVRRDIYRKSPEKNRIMEADPAIKSFGTCMVKTHFSLSHDPDLKGRPVGWELPISDILLYKGAGFVVPVAGAIKLMPGTASNPAFRRIDVDVKPEKFRDCFNLIR